MKLSDDADAVEVINAESQAKSPEEWKEAIADLICGKICDGLNQKVCKINRNKYPHIALECYGYAIDQILSLLQPAIEKVQKESDARKELLMQMTAKCEELVCRLSQAREDTARKIIKDVEDTLDITDDTYVRISNHVPFDAWQALKSRWGGE